MPNRDWPWIIRYLMAHGMSYYGISEELNRRSPYRKLKPTEWRQVQRYEAGVQPIWDDGQALIELYLEADPLEQALPSRSQGSSSHGHV